jgi:hypothetical protein
MELSTTDILIFLSVAAGIVLAVWAPGWVVAWGLGRTPRPAATPHPQTAQTEGWGR